MSYRNIPGRCAYLWIYDEWIKTAPKDAIAVEVGVALGRSIAHLARLCIDAGRGDIRIYAVDAWAGVARNGEQQLYGDNAGGDFCLFAQQMLQHAPAEFQRINVIRTWSTDAARLFDPGTVDLVVLDADHTYEWVSAEIRAWRPLLKSDGVLGGDDYHPTEFPGVIQAVREVYADDRIEVRHDQSWPTWRVLGASK
jgi:predicted O-methyltransferase YrrM